MEEAKIRLSKQEFELVSNSDWILTKNNILEKAKLLLGQLQLCYQHHLQEVYTLLPKEVVATSPKISKGENYKGLPYLVLDYPRCFAAENIFAIRTMFWWGNFFSISLHLSGQYKKEFENRIVASLQLFAANNFFICVNEDPWQHGFEKENFLPIQHFATTGFEKLVKNKSFLKVAAKISLNQWSESDKILPYYFRQILAVITG